ncbi:nucleotide-diphospho-sugar transferase [Piromyces finnis]|uniref:Nucleotide-diphospho-sugar transferase n=1 Tax=Piromyces finnis TaxID=1754191 RepID=A0A1Y1UWA5_9FUNG|nr:nucleotide-diphospho-sugar transferase [Piromyces finnis]|eukprot:ORX42392.1 nucleotide-diphospho-sugar transferase [Piromyces finnis]
MVRKRVKLTIIISIIIILFLHGKIKFSSIEKANINSFKKIKELDTEEIKTSNTKEDIPFNIKNEGKENIIFDDNKKTNIHFSNNNTKDKENIVFDDNTKTNIHFSNNNTKEYNKENITPPPNNVKVSVIIPAYNLEKRIGRCIESALNQTLKDIEVIVIDDKSTDSTKLVIKEYEEMDNRVKPIYSETNNGAGYSRNMGIEKAKGEFVGFIDGDDFVDSGWFEYLYSNGQDMDIVRGIRVIHDFSEKFRKSRIKPYGCMIPTIIRKEFLTKHNLKFPVSKEKGEDSIFRASIRRENPKQVYAPDNGIYYHYDKREGSLSNYSKLRKFLKTINK